MLFKLARKITIYGLAIYGGLTLMKGCDLHAKQSQLEQRVENGLRKIDKPNSIEIKGCNYQLPARPKYIK